MGDRHESRWRRVAAAVAELDPEAGRALHAALLRSHAPPRIQIVGREGTGRADVRRALTVPPGVEVSVETVDSLDLPDPVLDADLIVYVFPAPAATSDPGLGHPVDRAVPAACDPCRVVAVVTGAVTAGLPQLGAGIAVYAAADPRLDAALAAGLTGIAARRADTLARTAVTIAASPAARDVIEAALDECP